jgi:hypothetical protein
MLADPVRARQRTVEFTGLDANLVKDMQPLRLNYTVRPDKWQHDIDLMIEAKVLEKPHQASEYFSEPLLPFIQQ